MIFDYFDLLDKAGLRMQVENIRTKTNRGSALRCAWGDSCHNRFASGRPAV